MRLQGSYSFAFLFLIIFSCNKQNTLNNRSSELEDFPVADLPKKVKLNLEDDYSINPVTEDSIQTFIQSSGDTVKTGVPIPVKGRIIDPNSVAKPRTIPVGKPTITPTNLNVHKLPDRLTVIPVNRESLKTFRPGVDNSSFVLISSTNSDTIPTGVPITIKGNILNTSYPQPVIALPPQVKESTRVNMVYLNTTKGMSSPNIYSTLEDKNGNIWIGTKTGVSRYDGNSFTHFTSEEEGIAGNVVSIMEDKNGFLWFGTKGGGAYMYDGVSFARFSRFEGLESRNIHSIIEDKAGNIWFGTGGAGAVMYKGPNESSNKSTITYFTEKEGLINNYVRSILEDKHGNIWFATDGGVSMYDGASKPQGKACFTNFTQKDGIGINRVDCILEDKSGNLWFGKSGGGVTKYNGQNLTKVGPASFTNFTMKDGLSGMNIASIIEDKSGDIWFADKDNGLNKFDGESFTHISESEGLSDNSVTSLYVDKSGILWVATESGGLNKYNVGSFVQKNEKDGLVSEKIRSIIEDKSGNYWIGTWNEGVFKYDGESFKQLTTTEGLISNTIISIMEDKNGNIWFGSYDLGVSLYNGKSFTNFTIAEGLSANNATCIFEDKSGNIWFGTHKGVSMYNGNFFTQFSEKEGLIDNDVRSIFQDRRGNLWFCTFEGGVSKFDGDTFTHFTKNEGLAHNYIWTGIEDSHGNLWFGSWGGGVSVYDGVSFRNFTENEGLDDNIVNSIQEDGNGSIWLGSNKKLTRITITDEHDINQTGNSTNNGKALSNNNYKIQIYNSFDGVKGFNFHNSCVILDSKNRIWWGTRVGVEILDMNDFNTSDDPPEVQMNSITINEEFMDFHSLKRHDSLRMNYSRAVPFYNYPENLVLEYDKNHLTFHFSAIDWLAPNKIKYSYKIDELKDEWSEPNLESKAGFRNLPHGNLTFKVKAIGQSQKWSEPFEYSFVILPPWWHTWWAKSFYIVIFLLVMMGLVHLRTRNLAIRSKKLQQTVEERTAEVVSALGRLKEAQSNLVQSEKMASLGQLTAGIAHEINNPVGFIKTNSIALDQDLTDIKKLINKYRSYIQKEIQDKSEIEDFEKSIEYETLISAINTEISNIKEGTLRTTEIVKNLREFSYKDDDEKRFTDIHRGIESTLNILKSRFSKQIRLTKNYDKSIGEIKCHLGQLNQVFLNLLTNALDAIEEKGEIEISTKNQKDSLLISIKDDGMGVPKEIIDKIFDPFFTTKKIGLGTGLGLSISHSIIKNHEGTITVSIGADQRTCFDIVLPRS
jgi:signal transduction histidine kinase/ligand-binding sensor domain-containing protein